MQANSVNFRLICLSILFPFLITHFVIYTHALVTRSFSSSRLDCPSLLCQSFSGNVLYISEGVEGMSQI